MANRIRTLFDTLMKLPFPHLGKTVGDFPLYDSLIAGMASSLLEGGTIHPDNMPVPDIETQKVIDRLKSKSHLNPHEAEFVAYIHCLDELREEIAKALPRQ